MVVLHTGFLIACPLEVSLERPFQPVPAGLLVLALGAQGLRWWCIQTLVEQWNTRVIVVPGQQRIQAGPYQWINHPNYVAVVICEGFALPLLHGAWLTALVFSTLNAWLLRVRLRWEEKHSPRLPREDRMPDPSTIRREIERIAADKLKLEGPLPKATSVSSSIRAAPHPGGCHRGPL